MNESPRVCQLLTKYRFIHLYELETATCIFMNPIDLSEKGAKDAASGTGKEKLREMLLDLRKDVKAPGAMDEAWPDDTKATQHHTTSPQAH